MKSKAFDVAEKYLKPQAAAPTSTAPESHRDVIDGDVKAILLDSDLGPLWFAFADNWKSGDDIPVFFANELPFLRRMTEAELRRRYTERAALGGGWIRDRIQESTKH